MTKSNEDSREMGSQGENPSAENDPNANSGEASSSGPSLEPNGSSDTGKSGDQHPPQDEADPDALPEVEPLTPELVEDEAIRGDFMIRWAVVLLAAPVGMHGNLRNGDPRAYQDRPIHC